ncbi:MAG: NgoBV family restriction endonuclease [Clostridia bacterium]|nr:NgoBV family restriction endonuclease [Clostridia bacterium]
MRLTAQQVYDKLINEDRILEIEGRITFDFGDVNIIVKQKDVVGNIIQEWLQGWLEKNGIDYAPSENTQMPPDIFLNPDDLTKDLLEVKAFNRTATPAFDIADFRAYQREIVTQPYMLHAEYLIFGYDMDENGIVTIKDVWLKKVWEITRRMENWPLNLQVKNNVVHKIRPGVFYSNRPRDFHIFRNMEDFLSAVEQTVWQNPDTRINSSTWKRQFLDSYEAFYGERLTIPRWDDIADTYRVGR